MTELTEVLLGSLPAMIRLLSSAISLSVFEPQEQVNEIQANLLGAAFELAIGGPAQAHVGIGGGGSSSELPWREQKNRPKRSR